MSVPKHNSYIRIGGKTGNFNKIHINSAHSIIQSAMCFLFICIFVYRIQLKYILNIFNWRNSV